MILVVRQYGSIMLTEVTNTHKAIIKTLSYADLFDYPLTALEIWRSLISTIPVSIKQIEKLLLDINSKDGYYYLSGRVSIVRKRKQREKESEKKLEIAKKISLVLGVIPSVTLIGVSGNLAVRNAKKSDDIDLFIIVKKNTLWTTRLFLIILLKVLGKHRGRFSKEVADKICINMLVDEHFLYLAKERQSLYTAHEVMQMMPLFQRNGMYEKFIKANLWIKKFMPNALRRRTKRNFTKNHTENVLSVFVGFIQRFSALEEFVKKFQLWYMRKHRSTEYISDKTLAFHPRDYTYEVINLYKERLKKYGI